jgi:hypothetical protein
MSLTRDEILKIQDIKTKKIHVPQWGNSIHIRQLTRGEQDEYLKRQYGATKMKSNQRAKEQQIEGVNIYGHDSFICVCGICDADGKPIFTRADLKALEAKNGEAIGFIASEIVKFSGMESDVDEIAELEELKN